MPKTAMIRARIEPALKKKAENHFKKLGMSTSQAINTFYMQVVIHKGIPFEIRLEHDDIEEKYIKVRDDEHLDELLGLKNVPTTNTSGRRKNHAKVATKNTSKKQTFS